MFAEDLLEETGAPCSPLEPDLKPDLSNLGKSELGEEEGESSVKQEQSQSDIERHDEREDRMTELSSRKPTKSQNSTRSSRGPKLKPQKTSNKSIKPERSSKDMKQKRMLNTYQHVRPSELRPTGKITCDICGRMAKNYDCMRKHMVRFHMAGGRGKGAKGRETAADESEKNDVDYSCISSADLRPAGPYECDICHMKLSRFDAMRAHLKRHSAGRQPMVECEICHAKMVHQASLKVHMRKHTGKLPYMCDVCGKSFNHPFHLR